MEMHDMIDTIERRLKSELKCEAVIHMDPIITDDHLVVENRARIEALLQEKMDSRITIHDFRMVVGPTHTNVIFDALIPHDCKMPEPQLRAEIRKWVSSMDPRFFAVVTIDHPFTAH